MATVDADDLLPNQHVKDAVASGDVTQLTRGAGNRYASEGDAFEVDGERFVVAEVVERRLGDLTDEDARREGSPSLDAYRERMARVHPGEFEWDPDAPVRTYRFERA
jgi:hypothetical protein